MVGEPRDFDYSYGFSLEDDGSVEIHICTADGDTAARMKVRPMGTSKLLKLSWSNLGRGRYSLKTDWIPITRFLGPWFGGWRWVRLEVEYLWWMLKR